MSIMTSITRVKSPQMTIVHLKKSAILDFKIFFKNVRKIKKIGMKKLRMQKQQINFSLMRKISIIRYRLKIGMICVHYDTILPDNNYLLLLQLLRWRRVTLFQAVAHHSRQID